jgi:hypothetical protein
MNDHEGVGPEAVVTDLGARKNVGSGNARSSKPHPQILQVIRALITALAAVLATETNLHHDDELAAIAARIAGLPPDEAAAIWRTIADALATVPRPDMVAKLRAMAPVLQRAGGDRLLSETVTALHDVARWFP